MENDPVLSKELDCEISTTLLINTKYGKNLTMVVNPVTRTMNFITVLPGKLTARRRTLEKALEYYNIGTN